MPDEAAEDFVPPQLTLLKQRLATACGGEDRRLFVLLDGARLPGLKTLLDELKIPRSCLFRGEAEGELADVAPYLVPLRLDGPLLPWFVLSEDGFRSALFVVAEPDGEALKTHLRRYLLVRDSGGFERYFRFYDPRVLGPFFEASSPAEAVTFFGPIKYLLAAGAEEPAASVKLRVWRRPEGPAEGSAPPSATDPFRLRKEHEAVFSRDMLARYERRCRDYLRAEYPHLAGQRSDEDLNGVIAMARRVAEHLEVQAGLDVTRVAEALVLRSEKEEFAAIAAKPKHQRSASLLELRDRKRAEAVRFEEPVR